MELSDEKKKHQKKIPKQKVEISNEQKAEILKKQEEKKAKKLALEQEKLDQEDARSDRSDNIYGIVELLTDKDYKKITFEHKGFEQDVYALKSASTDFDLTGQVIW